MLKRSTDPTDPTDNHVVAPGLLYGLESLLALDAEQMPRPTAANDLPAHCPQLTYDVWCRFRGRGATARERILNHNANHPVPRND